MPINPPLVSVLVICYNQERYIKEALTSALEQDYDNLEVVVADDASTDNTQQIIRELGKDHPEKLKMYFNPKNLGITANSNVGLKHCRGEFVAFMGGDDVLLPGKISRQVEWFSQDDSRVLCGHDVEWIDQNGALLGIRTSELVPISSGRGASGFIKHGTPFAATSVMVRRSRIPEYGFHPALPVVSDWKLWIDVIATHGSYGYIPGIWAQYRRHRDNVTAKLSWKITRDVLLTAVLSLWHFHGRYLINWAQYFFVRPIAKRFPKKPHV